MNNGSSCQDVHIQSQEPMNVSLYGKRDSEDTIKLWILTWEAILDCLDLIIGLLVKGMQ